MMPTSIETTVRSWPGTSTHDHRFGGREFRLADREFGHSHGDRQVDIPFPKRLRDFAVAENLTSKHHLYPDSGWVTKYLESDADVDGALTLLRLNYLYQVAALQRRETVDAELAGVDVEAELEALALPPGVASLFPPAATDSPTTAEG
ncbi:hypothetical protein HSB1_25540 [Halogranum salarium B-1]|uniref:Luciferase domain-containing protein n=2 Tax=Halogranum rubrum TaxID=553466 RepID=J3A1E1_9EURY|nr:hypothetical protein HSB1_25540 [Halogranum salarium B-1]